MKFLRMIWLLGIFFFGLLDNAAAQDKPRCVEYQISKAPVQCGPGYTGMKVPVVTFTCPDRRQVESFDTTGCIPAGTQPKNPLATNCSVTPGDAECMPLPKPSGCPAGKHWTTQGSGIAHCVGDDMNCPAGQTLTHDALGNPSCVPITCPSNQVLQADGKTCGCPAGTTWNGATCERPAAFCPPKKVTAINCPSGMAGQGIRTTTYTLPNCSEQVSDDFSQCNRNECPAPSSVTSACPAGKTGSIVTTTSYIGVACTPVTNITDNCNDNRLTCPNNTEQVIACPTGFTGSGLLKTTYDNANNCSRTDTVDNSGCKQSTSRLIEINFASHAPAIGIIGSNDLCGNGYSAMLKMIVPVDIHKELDEPLSIGKTCAGSGSDPSIGFLLIPKEVYENSIFVVSMEYPFNEYIKNCMLNNDCYQVSTMANGQSARDFYLKANGKDIYMIYPYRYRFSDENKPGFSAFVRKGELIGTFFDSSDWHPRSQEYYAPFDGYLLVGGHFPNGWGSAN